MGDTETVRARRVQEIEFSVRVLNALQNAGIETLGDLCDKTERELLDASHKGFCGARLGKKSIREIEDVLHELGLKLREEPGRPKRPPPDRLRTLATVWLRAKYNTNEERDLRAMLVEEARKT